MVTILRAIRIFRGVKFANFFLSFHIFAYLHIILGTNFNIPSLNMSCKFAQSCETIFYCVWMALTKIFCICSDND